MGRTRHPDKCPHGHPWHGPNADVYTRNGKIIYCRTCVREQRRQWRQAQTAQYWANHHAARMRRRQAAKTDRQRYPVRTEILDLLESHFGEWFTIDELAARLPHRRFATVRREALRLATDPDTESRLVPHPSGGRRTQLSVPFRTYLEANQ